MIDVVFINSFRNGGKVSSTVVSGYSKAGGATLLRGFGTQTGCVVVFD